MADIKKLKKELANRQALIACAREFGVVGDLNRLKICYLLCSHPELTVSQIAESIGMTISATSHALRRLRQIRLVENRRDFRQVFYRLKNNQLSKLIRESLKV